MRKSQESPGYLAKVEASHLDGQALPGAVVVTLRRELQVETAAGRPARRMFIELTISEAVQHWRAMGDLIRKAGALEQQPSHADAAGNL